MSAGKRDRKKIRFAFEDKNEQKLFKFPKDDGSIGYILIRRFTKSISQVVGYDPQTKKDIALDEAYSMYGGEVGDEEKDKHLRLTLGSFLIVRLGSYELRHNGNKILEIKDPKIQEITEVNAEIVST